MHPEALTKEGARLFLKINQFDGFYLAGGTALALQIGHRISVDFDLFGAEDIAKDLLQKVKRVFSESTVLPLINNPEELSVLIDGVKVTFLKYPFPVIDELTNLDGLESLNIIEITATKAYTIGRRGSFKDYIDLYFVLSENHASLEQIIQLAEKKFGKEFNSRLFLEQLIYLEDIEEIKVTFLKERISQAQINTYFTEIVKSFSL